MVNDTTQRKESYLALTQGMQQLALSKFMHVRLAQQSPAHRLVRGTRAPLAKPSFCDVWYIWLATQAPQQIDKKKSVHSPPGMPYASRTTQRVSAAERQQKL